MHQVLYIPEILLNIFGHCSDPTGGDDDKLRDLAVLARTCKAFKEPALDLLWGDLPGPSPLARCLPDVCRSLDSEEIQPVEVGGRYLFRRNRSYLFSRPLNELEWNTLQGYTHRVRHIRRTTRGGILYESAIRVIFHEAPLADPLFPKLRSLYWEDMMPFPLLQAAVPLLTSLDLYLEVYAPVPPIHEEFFDGFGDRCPDIEELRVNSTFTGLGSSAISRQICRWKNLQSVVCVNMVLSMDAILHLSSLPNLKSLAFFLGDNTIEEIPDSHSMLVFSGLVDLAIDYKSWEDIALLHHIRLPAIQSIDFHFSNFATRRVIRTCWAAIQEACPSNSLTCLELSDFETNIVGPALNGDDDFPPWVTLEGLRPCTSFSGLRKLIVNFRQSVHLTDGDLLELVSPQLEKFIINYFWGWRNGHVPSSGITLSGLVQLLRLRPSLNTLCVAVDTVTFTEIPEGLDVWYPPRELNLNFLDSYIEPEYIPGLVSVLTALRVEPAGFTPWIAYEVIGGPAVPEWQDVHDELERVFKQQSPPSEMQ